MEKMKIGILADDFTGALDAGAQFVGYGYVDENSPWQVAFRLSGQPSSEVEIINTASREVPPQNAFEVNQQSVAGLVGRLLYKKVDSTMRGNIAPEIMAILGSSAYQKALLCPAAPAQGRTVIGGQVFVAGVPLDQTSFKDDPVHPARSSSMQDLLGVPTTHIPLAIVREGVQAVSAAIFHSGSQIITCDAAMERDLDVVAQATIASGVLPCGAFGLAKSFIHALPNVKQYPNAVQSTAPLPKPILVLVGSANQKSRHQVSLAEDIPNIVVKYLPAQSFEMEVHQALVETSHATVILAGQAQGTIRTPEWMSFGQTLSRMVVRQLQPEQIGSLVVVGGETLAALTDAAKTESIILQGERMPGVPLVRFEGGVFDGMLTVTKAGGFGDDQTLVKILS